MEINTYEEFKEFLEKNNQVLIDFYATWCGPCKMLSPILHNMDEQGKLEPVKLITIDVDKNPKVASMYGIQAIPTLIYIKDKQIVNTSLGFIPEDKILELISK